jgi:membrane-associated protein
MLPKLASKWRINSSGVVFGVFSQIFTAYRRGKSICRPNKFRFYSLISAESKYIFEIIKQAMDIINFFIDFILRLDVHLGELIRDYGTWTYAILFVIIFCETGLVVTPFLPGDSLLFATGAFAATGVLDPWIAFVLISVAAVLGDAVNYSIGKRLGARAFSGKIRFLKQEHLQKTHEFYEKHGGKTIIIARFIPIIRTFAPFVAGIGSMTYTRFFSYNVFGGVGWAGIFIFVGYFFGNLPFVKSNFSLVIIAIIIISVIPAVVEYIRSRRTGAANKA